MNIAAQITEWVFSSPFLWMTLLGIVSANSMRRNLLIVSMPYAPLLEEKNESRMSGRMMLSFLTGIAVALAVYFTSATVSYFYVIGIWLVAFIFMAKSKEAAAFPAAAFIIGIIYFFTEGSLGINKIVRMAALYQTALGALYLFGKKETYPVMQQGKDGKIYGEHIFSQVWIMPAVVLSLSTSDASLFSYAMLVFILFSDVRIRHTLPKRYFNDRGIYMAATGIGLLLLSFIQSDIAQSIILLAAVPSIVILWFIRERAIAKKSGYIFVADSKGVQIFYVYCDSPASAMGIEIGDVLTSINGHSVVNYEAVEKALEERPPFIWLEIMRGDRKIETEYKDYENGIEDLGFVPTPKNPSKFELYPRPGFFGRVLKHITGSFTSTR